MKKSECFSLAQESVIKNMSLSTEDKLEIIRVLIKEEDLARYVEKEKEKKEMAVNNG